MDNSCQPLAIDIVQNGGHHYRQVWRDEHAAVYEQKGDRRIVIGYEAITIKKRPEEMKFGKVCPARELYPCAEDWGKIAVTRRTLESAIEAAKLFSTRAAPRAAGQIHRPLANLVGSGQPTEVAAYTNAATPLHHLTT